MFWYPLHEGNPLDVGINAVFQHAGIVAPVDAAAHKEDAKVFHEAAGNWERRPNEGAPAFERNSDASLPPAGDTPLSDEAEEFARNVNELLLSLQDALVSSNHQEDGTATFGIDDESLRSLLLTQVLQYMLWIVDAGRGTSDKDARAISAMTGQELSIDSIKSLLSEGFVPEGFGCTEPSAAFALARVMAMSGAADPGDVVIPIYDYIGELLVGTTTLWGNERRDRVDEYRSMLQRGISALEL